MALPKSGGGRRERPDRRAASGARTQVRGPRRARAVGWRRTGTAVEEPVRSTGLPAPRARLAGSAGQPRAFGRGQTIGRRARGDRSHRRLAAQQQRAPARRRRTSGVEPGFACQAAHVAAAKPGTPPGDRARAPAGPPTGAAPCPAASRSGSVRHRPALQAVSAADAAPAIETEGRNPTTGFGGEHREPESATASDKRAGRLPNAAWCNTCKISDTSAVHAEFAAAFGQFWWTADRLLSGRRMAIADITRDCRFPKNDRGC